MVIPESRSCEERDGRGFKPLLEHLSFLQFFFSFGFFMEVIFFFKPLSHQKLLFLKKSRTSSVQSTSIDLYLRTTIGFSAGSVLISSSSSPILQIN